MATAFGANIGPSSKYTKQKLPKVPSTTGFKVSLPTIKSQSIKSLSVRSTIPTLPGGSGNPPQGAGSTSDSQIAYGGKDSKTEYSGTTVHDWTTGYNKPTAMTSMQAADLQRLRAEAAGGHSWFGHGISGFLGKAMDSPSGHALGWTMEQIARGSNAVATSALHETQWENRNHQHGFGEFIDPGYWKAVGGGFIAGARNQEHHNSADALEAAGTLKGHGTTRDIVGLGWDVGSDPLNLVGGAGVWSKVGTKGFGVVNKLSDLDKAVKAEGLVGHGAQLAEYANHARALRDVAPKSSQELLQHVLSMSAKDSLEAGDTETLAMLSRMAQAEAKSNMVRHLGIRIGPKVIRTPIKTSGTLEARLARAAGESGKIKASLTHLQAAFKPGFLDPVTHAGEITARHIGERLTQATLRVAFKQLERHLHIPVHEQEDILAAIAGKKIMKSRHLAPTGVIPREVNSHELRITLRKAGYSGDKLAQAMEYVKDWNNVMEHLRVGDVKHGVWYKKALAEGEVYIPKTVSKKGHAAFIASKSKLAKAGFETHGQNLSYADYLRLAREGGIDGKHLVTNPMELMAFRIQKGAMAQATAHLRSALRDVYGKSDRVWDEAKSAKIEKKLRDKIAKRNRLLATQEGLKGQKVHQVLTAGKTRKAAKAAHTIQRAEKLHKINAIEETLRRGVKRALKTELKPLTKVEARNHQHDLIEALQADYKAMGWPYEIQILYVEDARSGMAATDEAGNMLLRMPTPDTPERYLVGLHEIAHLRQDIISHTHFEGWGSSESMMNIALQHGIRGGGFDELGPLGAGAHHYQVAEEAQAWNMALEMAQGVIDEDTLKEATRAFHTYLEPALAAAPEDGGAGLALHELPEVDLFHSQKPRTHTPGGQFTALSPQEKGRLAGQLTQLRKGLEKHDTTVADKIEQDYADALSKANTQLGEEQIRHEAELVKVGEEIDRLQNRKIVGGFKKRPKGELDGMKKIDTLKMPIYDSAGTKILGYTEHYVPHEIHEQVANVERFLMDPGYGSEVERNIAKALSVWKMAVTVVNPGYRFRNTISDMWNMFVSGVPAPMIPIYQARAVAFQRTYAKAMKKVAAGEKLTAKETKALHMGNLMHDHGILSGQFMGDVAKFVKAKVGKTRNPGKLYVKKATEFNINAENNTRIAHMLYRMDTGHNVASAAEKVRTTHFDYEDLTPQEQRLKGSLIPFYTWTRKNVPLQIKMLGENPAKFNHYAMTAQTAEDESGPRGIIGTSLDYAPSAFKLGPGFVNLQIGINDVANASNPDQLLGQLNPALKSAIELMSNHKLGAGQVAISGADAPGGGQTQAPGFLAAALGAVGMGGTTQRLGPDGTKISGPSIDSRVAYMLQELPLTGALLAQNDIDSANRPGVGPGFLGNARLQSYLTGVGYIQPQAGREMYIAKLDEEKQRAAYFADLRKAGLWEPVKTSNKKSAYDLEVERLLKQINGG